MRAISRTRPGPKWKLQELSRWTLASAYSGGAMFDLAMGGRMAEEGSRWKSCETREEGVSDNHTNRIQKLAPHNRAVTVLENCCLPWKHDHPLIRLHIILSQNAGIRLAK